MTRLDKARAFLADAEAELRAYEQRKAEGRSIGLYDDLITKRQLVAAREELALAEAEARKATAA